MQTESQIRILIADDEQAVCALLHDELNERGYVCTEVFDGRSALSELTERNHDIALLDIRLPGLSGIDLLTELRIRHINTVAVMLTAVDSIETAVTAMKLGATDYITKPFDLNGLLARIGVALAGPPKACIAGGCAGEIDAIALGVEQRCDMIDGHSKSVILRTARIARELGIDDAEIDKWVRDREMLASKRKLSVRLSVEKLKTSPLAQIVLGLSKPYSRHQSYVEPRN